jgi:hypothetical protein
MFMLDLVDIHLVAERLLVTRYIPLLLTEERTSNEYLCYLLNTINVDSFRLYLNFGRG